MTDTTLDGLPPLPWQNEEFEYDFEAWLETRTEVEVSNAIAEYARAAVLAEREAIAVAMEKDVGLKGLGVAIPIALAAAIRARK